MSLEFHINLKPALFRCPDCAGQFPDWRMLFLHWRKTFSELNRHPDARRLGPHWSPRDRKAAKEQG